MRAVRRGIVAAAAVVASGAFGPAGARTADMWVIDVSAYPTRVVVTRVEATVHGTVPAVPGTGEVRVETHVLADGEELPCPVYASDGTSAREDEMFWTVELERADCPTHPPGSAIEADFVGRTLTAEWSSCHHPGPADLRFRVTVVAVRSAGTGVDAATFGDVKSGYR